MQVMLIGIAGPSGGGKTSVTEAVKNEVGNEHVIVINYDDYYKDQSDISMEDRIKVNYDHPNAFDNELLLMDLQKLKNNETINKPIYDFALHTRSSKKEIIEPKPIIIVEGLFALLDEKLRNELNLKIFVAEDSDICFIRRLKRDVKERGRTMDSIIEQYMTTVKPMQEQFIEPTKTYADIILPHGKENKVGIRVIANNINEFLKKNK